MGWVRTRRDDDGRPHYMACYRDARGKTRSAGTFATKKAANAASAQAEVLLSQGKLGGADVGKLPFKKYVDDVWFPHHILEPTTRESYRYTIDKHLMPFFGSMRTNAIMPSHVREWVSDRVSAGVSPATIRHTKIVLSAIFTTALNDAVVTVHACRGVKTPTVPRKEFRIVTPAQFDSIYDALPDEMSRPQRLHGWRLPVHPVPGRFRRLPRPSPGSGSGPAAGTACGGHRRPPVARLVHPQGLETCLHRRWDHRLGADA